MEIRELMTKPIIIIPTLVIDNHSYKITKYLEVIDNSNNKITKCLEGDIMIDLLKDSNKIISNLRHKMNPYLDKEYKQGIIVDRQLKNHQ